MTINLLFITITFKWNKMTDEMMAKDALQCQKIEKVRDENYLKVVKSGYFW